MISDIRDQISLLLSGLSDVLDISESLYKKATERYTEVGKWLCEDGSPLADYKPDIYPQGSFNLGTVIKPYTENDEYDIDLVCELSITKQECTQQRLKKMVGDRLKENNSPYKRMLEPEGRRCWTLHYDDDTLFHMDILPALPDEDFRLSLRELNIPEELANSGICITDREHENYHYISTDWPCSNPKGFAQWFRSRMQVRYDEQRQLIMKQRNLASIDEVPHYAVKTPLQRCVQILKRHRNIKFGKDFDDKPTSIIITTLAGRAYSNEIDLFEAMYNIVNGMIAELESYRGIILNPVNPNENFADKWCEHPQREEIFKTWLYQVREDLDAALRENDIREAAQMLMPRFGEKMIRLAASRAGIVLALAPSVQIHKTIKPWGFNV